MKVKSLSRVRLSEIPWTAAYQAPPTMGFSRQEYWSGVPLPSPTYGFKHRNGPLAWGILPDPSFISSRTLQVWVFVIEGKADSSP